MLSIIKTYAYQLYKNDWERTHAITFEMKQDLIRNYLEAILDGIISDVEAYPFEDYLLNYGYVDMIYVSFDEFLDNEYRDTEYMKELIDNDRLYQVYLKDVEN